MALTQVPQSFKLFVCASSILVVAIFFSNLHLYIYLSLGVGIVPYYWVILALIAALVATLCRLHHLELPFTALHWWVIYFTFLTVIGTFYANSAEAAWIEARVRALTIVFLLSCAILFHQEGAIAAARWAILVVALIAVPIAVYDHFRPGWFGPIIGRGAGPYLNPNQCAAALVLAMILTVGLVPNRVRTIYCAYILIGILATVSRSGLAGWLIVMAYFWWKRYVRLPKATTMFVPAAVFLPLLLGVIATYPDIVDANFQNSKSVFLQRVGQFVTMDFTDESSVEREQLFAIAFETISQAPVLGVGLGATLDWHATSRAHNIYLEHWIQHGIIGLTIFPLLLLSIIANGLGEARVIATAMALFFALFGLFSHNVIEERYILVAIALQACMTESAKRSAAQGPARTVANQIAAM